MIPATPVAALPGLVRRAVLGRPGTRWVGLDGLGASGKTTLAAMLAAAVPDLVVVPVDDFARPGVRGWERGRFTTQVLEPLLAGRPARYQRWDFAADVGGAWVTVPAGVPVLVEGVSATDVRVAVPWDLTIWLEVAEQVRRQRIRARDPVELLAVWEDDWWPSEEAYVAEQRPAERASVVVRPAAEPAP